MNPRILFAFALVLTAIHSFGQNKEIDSLFADFKKDSFYGKIEPAKMKLESLQKEIIPQLIELLMDTGFVKLTGTADLIYPGATEFYGHGSFIPYDMDWISVRAGWLLENLTFMNFGYKTSGVDDTTLFKLMKDSKRYNEYLKTGSYDLEWKNKPTREKLIEFRKILAQNAKEWWQKNQESWTRLSAINEALRSNDENRLGMVLQFLRYGETRCDNLNTKIYLKEIKSLVVNLKQTQYQSVKEQASLLLQEDLHYWTRKMEELDQQKDKLHN